MADAQRPEDRLNTPGDQFAEWIARFMGSPRFLLWMTVFVVSWIVLNLLGSWHHWDPYPFILLNLAFSTQAAYSAPRSHLAQNRQAARDKASRDFVRSELRDQLHELLFELEHGNSPDDESSPSPEDAQ